MKLIGSEETIGRERENNMTSCYTDCLLLLLLLLWIIKQMSIPDTDIGKMNAEESAVLNNCYRLVLVAD